MPPAATPGRIVAAATRRRAMPDADLYASHHLSHLLAFAATVVLDAAALALALRVRRVAVAAAVGGVVLVALALALRAALALALGAAALALALAAAALLVGGLAIAAAVVWVSGLVFAGVVRGGGGSGGDGGGTGGGRGRAGLGLGLLGRALVAAGGHRAALDNDSYPCWGGLLPLQEELLCPKLSRVHLPSVLPASP